VDPCAGSRPRRREDDVFERGQLRLSVGVRGVDERLGPGRIENGIAEKRSIRPVDAHTADRLVVDADDAELVLDQGVPPCVLCLVEVVETGVA
jgi:hypothetical protein